MNQNIMMNFIKKSPIYLLAFYLPLGSTALNAQKNSIATASFVGGVAKFEFLLKQYFATYSASCSFVTGGSITFNLTKNGKIRSIKTEPTLGNGNARMYTEILSRYFTLTKYWQPSRDEYHKKTDAMIDVFILVGNGGIEYNVDEFQKVLGRRLIFKGVIHMPKVS
jgi:hypothetical protein